MPVKPITRSGSADASAAIRYEGLPGNTINSELREMVQMANRTGRTVVANLNGVPYQAQPGATFEELVGQREAHYKSPAYIAHKKEIQAQQEAEQKARDAQDKAALARENNRPARTGDALIKGLQADAKKAGYRAWDFYAVCNLRSREEILEFAKIYKTQFPAVAEKNIRAAVGNKTAPLTDGFWKEALNKLGGGSFEG